MNDLFMMYVLYNSYDKQRAQCIDKGKAFHII